MNTINRKAIDSDSVIDAIAEVLAIPPTPDMKQLTVLLVRGRPAKVDTFHSFVPSRPIEDEQQQESEDGNGGTPETEQTAD